MKAVLYIYFCIYFNWAVIVTCTKLNNGLIWGFRNCFHTMKTEVAIVLPNIEWLSYIWQISTSPLMNGNPCILDLPIPLSK